jgi:GT2 family glycosyltransferase
LYQITYPNYDVIVVDNGSKDDSIEKIKEYAEGKIKRESMFFEYSDKNKPIKIIEYAREEAEAGGSEEKGIRDLPSNRKLVLIKNEKNYGFTGGNNIGMRHAFTFLNPDYSLLLNNDTVVDREFLVELVNTAMSDPNIGFVGPKIYYYNYKGRNDIINFAGAKQNMWKSEGGPIGDKEVDLGQRDANREVDFIHGSCMLVRTEMINEIGLLDTMFFSIMEENDWCMRGYKNGWKSIYAFKARIWHKGSRSVRKHKPLAIYYTTRNRFLFMKKHATRRQYLSFLLYFFGFLFWFTSGSYLVYHGDVKNFVPFFKGVIDGLKISVNKQSGTYV